jgi:hypothetical protein
VERQHPPNCKDSSSEVRRPTDPWLVKHDPMGFGSVTIIRCRFPQGSLVRPQIRRDNPLNLSISLGGGKETNKDSLSNGE